MVSFEIPCLHRQYLVSFRVYEVQFLEKTEKARYGHGSNVGRHR